MQEKYYRLLLRLIPMEEKGRKQDCAKGEAGPKKISTKLQLTSWVVLSCAKLRGNPRHLCVHIN